MRSAETSLHIARNPPKNRTKDFDGPEGFTFATLEDVTSSGTASGRQRRKGSGGSTSAVVSYRLRRQREVDAVLRGDRTGEQVCDAQPELRRVAHNWGTVLPEPCPICNGDDLAAVTFAFGAGLPKSGRVVSDMGESEKLQKRGRPSSWYVIEVCRQCWWNHLRESFEVSG